MKDRYTRRRFFRVKRHRIPYGIIMGAAILAFALIFFMIFRFLTPVCQV